MPIIQIGDTLQFRTGTIYDHNHYPVPDGTVVRFIITSGGEIGTSQQLETTTRDGVAQATYLIQGSGIYDVRVASEPALNSEEIQINIETDEEPNGTEIQEVLVTQTAEPTKTATNEPEVDDESATPIVKNKPKGIHWLFSTIITWVGGFAIYWFTKKHIANRWSIRWALLSIIGGTAAYLYLAIGLPGSSKVLMNTQFGGVLIVVYLGLLSGWMIGYIWRKTSQK